MFEKSWLITHIYSQAQTNLSQSVQNSTTPSQTRSDVISSFCKPFWTGCERFMVFWKGFVNVRKVLANNTQKLTHTYEPFQPLSKPHEPLTNKFKRISCLRKPIWMACEMFMVFWMGFVKVRKIFANNRQILTRTHEHFQTPFKTPWTPRKHI